MVPLCREHHRLWHDGHDETRAALTLAAPLYFASL
jgi:hypothetical protein